MTIMVQDATFYAGTTALKRAYSAMERSTDMQTYTVRHSDTLMQIAKEQHVEPTLLKKFNPTAARRPLLAGQTLLLPRKVRVL